MDPVDKLRDDLENLMSAEFFSFDINYMREALRLADLRRGFCAPNPSVGAVIVQAAKVIARGLHWASGCAHAELDALRKLEPGAAFGATLYVTLEPCCHIGKTPPCTDAIIASGIKEVVYGLRDPNPLVAGKGEKALLDAGILCRQLELPELDQFYESYCYWQSQGRPWVTAKLALSLDGKIAEADGRPAVITGPELAQFTHQCRKRVDAILTTLRTIQADDPQFNVRLGDEMLAKPIYVLDRLLAIPREAKIFKTAARVTLFYQASLEVPAWLNLAAHCVPLFDWPAVLEQIGRDGIHDLWVEAGGKCFQSLCEHNLLNRGLIYLGAKKLGVEAKTAFSADFDVFSQTQAMSWGMVGGDAVCELDFMNSTVVPQSRFRRPRACPRDPEI